MSEKLLKSCKTFLFDLDGTVYCGNKPVPGAAELISALRERGCRVKYVSNNSSHAVDFVREKLGRMGIETENENIITPLSAAGDFITGAFGRSSVFVLGTRALQSSIAAAGHRMVSGIEDCGVVVIGRDIEITYEKIETAGILLQRGASCVVCNCDDTHPGELGYLVPETGAFFNMMRTVCGVEDCREIGKPDPYLYTYAITGEDPRTCVMVGDNPDTDILGARRANCRTVLLRGPLSAGREDCADVCVEKLTDILDHMN